MSSKREREIDRCDLSSEIQRGDCTAYWSSGDKTNTSLSDPERERRTNSLLGWTAGIFLGFV